MDIKTLWDDVNGDHADAFIWDDEHAAAFLGYSTAQTVVKNRSQRIGPIAAVQWRRFGRRMRCRPRDLAAAVVDPERGAA